MILESVPESDKPAVSFFFACLCLAYRCELEVLQGDDDVKLFSSCCEPSPVSLVVLAFLKRSLCNHMKLLLLRENVIT